MDDSKDKAMQQLVEDCIFWAASHGLVMGKAGWASHQVSHAPFSLLPSILPKDEFHKAADSMPPMMRLYHAITRDEAYLEATLATTAKYDTFTADQLTLLRQSRPARQALQKSNQDIALALLRSDYMLDEPSGKLLQVEMNTIASSFASLSAITTQMHAYVLDKLKSDSRLGCLGGDGVGGELCSIIKEYVESSDGIQMPQRSSLEGTVQVTAAAVDVYCDTFEVEGKTCKPALVTVHLPDEFNAIDQKWLALKLWENHKIPVIRKTLAQLNADATVDPDSGKLLVDGQEVAVVYYRSGYAPEHYENGGWEARLKLENSRAVKCPNIAWHLAGAKKVQQDLASPGVLQKYLSEPEAQQVSEMFAELFGFGEEGGLGEADEKVVISKAINHPDDFVLKPQREGGGNNLYGDEMVEKLKQRKELAAYILMQKIKPQKKSAILVREGEWGVHDVLSELGVFGALVSRGDEVVSAQTTGHLLRTKRASSNEGGIAAGFAVLDTPVLR